jgi:hypothetical protein
MRNNLMGYAPQWATVIPGIANAQTDVQRFDELNKFLKQNSLRAWQAAGGTGTNAQLETQESANPNSTHYAKTIQDLAYWNKGGELALQARNKARAQFLQDNTPDQLPKFDAQWSANLNPQVFQLQGMVNDSTAAKDFINSLSTEQAKKLAADKQRYRSMGVIQ